MFWVSGAFSASLFLQTCVQVWAANVCKCTHTHTHTHTHTYVEYYTAIKKNKIMPFVATLMQLRLSY